MYGRHPYPELRHNPSRLGAAGGAVAGRTVGTLVGMFGGLAIGAGVGALAAGRRGALIGGVFGAFGGGVGGGIYGTYKGAHMLAPPGEGHDAGMHAVAGSLLGRSLRGLVHLLGCRYKSISRLHFRLKAQKICSPQLLGEPLSSSGPRSCF